MFMVSVFSVNKLVFSAKIEWDKVVFSEYNV